MLVNTPIHWTRRSLILALVAGQAFLFSIASVGGATYPGSDWEDDYDPIASPDAMVGGKFRMVLGPYPSSFNYYTNYTIQSIAVFSLLYDQLFDVHSTTLDWSPRIASSIDVTDDQLGFTINLDPKAVWSDGKAITSDDFLFTWETILDPTSLAGVHKYSLEKFESPEIVDSKTIKLRAREVDWSNLVSLASFIILPKHHFEGLAFNEQDFEFPVVSGRYEISELKEGSYMRLERRKVWWLDDQKRFVGTDNFQTIEFRFYATRDLMWEAFRAGDVDLFASATSAMWNTDAKGEAFDNNWIGKQRVYNKSPIGFQGLSMNMREPPFDDIRVRKAMAHMLDRRTINETMLFGEYFMQNSIYHDLYGPENPNTNPQYEYEPETARRLLSEAGWKANPDTGILEKDGKPFEFTFLAWTPSFNKYLVIYQEALKDVGIEMKIQEKDWAAWTKDMDEFNFEMTLSAWGAPIFRSPEGMWNSKEADRKASNNIYGFKNAGVDALIDKQRGEFDINKRSEILREIDKLIQSEMPVVMIWMVDFMRAMYWNRFGMPESVYDKFNDEESALHYWWADPDIQADFDLAKENGEALPPLPERVVYDEIFGDQ
ncbi:MAG: hypothetical protein CBD18_09240 [Opitutales bacterium TMED158]|nr:MAG: hypothetical protein CBD18_09240 [Opitutales bacterium TMED158]